MSVKVIILTEGGTNIGIGHITRCISLCDAFAERGIFPELVIKGDASLAGALRWKPHRILNWHEERDALLDILESASIAIIDSYIATPAAYRLIADKVAVAAYIDDNNRMAYPRGHVINGSVYAEGLDYPRGVDIVYLLGSQYIPIRREFWKDSGKIIRERPERIMVTFGGDDSKRMTARILRYLCAEFPHLRKDVVVGKMAGYGEELSRLADKKTDIRYDLGADEMKETMMDADMAVS
ncbi:MAG: UDP-2,4-diacetamido-2,4,6-trideoxy-beta-L-altropyranose hydrolase, partial [Candidatus Omnitrophica bacterium]|nr:UDP-2,4-diacetamido-2,4,6-trideoxy-beta-L-altropyranose hydrolase [Candidatus Omnitrophota bacterium]